MKNNAQTVKNLGERVLFVMIKLLDDIMALWHARDVRDSSSEASGKVLCIRVAMVVIAP